MQFATLTITARYCYSTPPSETPETSAFLQIDDHRPDQAERRVFSGWMYASSPGLNGMQHPLYDVWVINCKTNAPGQTAPSVTARTPVKPVSPNAGANEAMPRCRRTPANRRARDRRAQLGEIGLRAKFPPRRIAPDARSGTERRAV